jgi:4-hydroxythreonine-4-phosphate dehydrogenase
VLHITKEIKQGNLEFYIGNISKTVGIIALNSIIEATKYTINRVYDALVTLPVSKSAIHLYSKKFVGHTEIITELCNKKQSLMILFAGNLRIALATIHTPIHKISKQITSKKLRTLCKNFNKVLKNDFGIKQPRIAVLGLNPHASDNGMFGKEEKNIIIPTIEIMKKKGLNIEGAFSADGFFASKNYTNFDGVIAMYHDQGLIPLKMLSSDGGVNFTANLPIIRTSPDHGTAFEIAGKNIANLYSMQEAINSAIMIAENRKK